MSGSKTFLDEYFFCEMPGHIKGRLRLGGGGSGSAKSGQIKDTYVVTVTSKLGQRGEEVKKVLFSSGRPFWGT